MSKQSKAAALDERCNEIEAVSAVSKVVAELHALSRQPKLGVNRAKRIDAWRALQGIAQAHADSLEMVGMNPEQSRNAALSNLGAGVERFVAIPSGNPTVMAAAEKGTS